MISRAAVPMCGLLLMVAGPARSEPVDLDAGRSAWRFERPVTRWEDQESPSPPFVALDLPMGVAAHAERDLRDLRLVAADGTEVPYVLDRQVEREAQTTFAGHLIDARQERKRSSQWVVDLGAPRTFDRVLLEVPDRDFAKRLRVELSEDGQRFSRIADDVGVFDREWERRVHHTTIRLASPVGGRFLRLTTDDTRSSPITLAGLTVSSVRPVGAAEWRQRAVVEPLPGRAGVSRYRVEIAFAAEELWLDAADEAFDRRLDVLGVHESNGRREERALSKATVYRLRLDDAALSGESLAIALGDPGPATELVLEVHDGDSPPLHDLRIELVAAARRLIFPARYRPLRLYYGNPATRAPLYDLETLRERVFRAARLERATVGPESGNPRFQASVPLPFTAPVGAPLEPSEWRYVRRLSPVEREDLYTLRLEPEDLAVLRSDLADLRLADAAGRQVPYVLTPDAFESWVELEIEQDEGHPSAGRLSRYRLRPRPAVAPASAALPFQALELDIAEPFFSRSARILAEPQDPPARHRPQVVFAGKLARGGDRSGPDPATVVVALDGARHPELRLEVDEGDDAPLTLRRARGRVLTPRVAFKARAGQLRLLLGNAEARSPRYDLVALRQAVLDHSAVVLAPGALGPNPAFRRGVSDYLRQAPPTLLLWGVLLAAAVTLLLLTARILSRDSPPADD